MVSLAPSHKVPAHGALGALLNLAVWPVSWLHVGPVDEYSFFPLWLGYILTVDALVLRHRGTSLITRSRVALLGMFLISTPLWWAFEGINKIAQNWHYLGAEEYSALRYAVMASWHFSVVIPAVFETAELVGSFRFVGRLQRGPAVGASRRFLGQCGIGGTRFVRGPRVMAPIHLPARVAESHSGSRPNQRSFRPAKHRRLAAPGRLAAYHRSGTGGG